MASFRYALRDTFRLVFRHWGLSILTLITAGAVIYLLGMSALFSLNVRSMVSKVESELVVQVYFKEGGQIQKTAEQIKTIPYVTYAKAVSPEEALERLRAKLGTKARAVTLLGENPLPWSVEVKVKRAGDVAPLVRKLTAMPEVDELVYAGKLAEKLSRISLMVSKISVVVLSLALIISALVVYNTIRISLYSRKEEIQVMVLVGATKTYISLPFVLQGMILGSLGALLAALAVAGSYSTAREAIWTTLPFVQLIAQPEFLLKFYLLLLGIGTTLGWICSWFAVSRFVRVAEKPL
ncbi:MULTISPECIES: cell division protein FtsX [Aminobacterium]|uniref:cell division protein FtsX n=1 Tax=Aminobacterium TaxID=81466 RepID=UPI0025809EF6|nr:permease-like cell division protein FtsX [Aminobacterium sp. UBA4987]